MSAKDAPIARKPMTFEEIKRISEKFRGNGLPAGTPAWTADGKCIVCGERPVRESPKNERGEEYTIGYLTCEECAKR